MKHSARRTKGEFRVASLLLIRLIEAAAVLIRITSGEVPFVYEMASHRDIWTIPPNKKETISTIDSHKDGKVAGLNGIPAELSWQSCFLY